MATPKTIAFQTLGCKLNFSETSMLAQQFRARGYHVVRDGEPADFFVLNTCSVTDFADRKCRKAVRHALRQNPDTRVIVTGCYAQLQPEEVADIPGVDLVLGAGHKFRMPDYVEALDRSTDRAWVFADAIGDVTEFHPSHSHGDRTRAFLKVQDGCDYKCAFCTIPKARGHSRSPRISEIVTQAQSLSAEGVMEVVLTGVNIGDFGVNQDGSRETFYNLITALEHETAVPRYRISSIEPNLCDAGIIEFVAGAQRFMPHFHMPLQSGCDRTLRRMRRRYNSDLYAQRVQQIKSAMPHACIGVDVIVGFPGETEEDFRHSVEFIESLEISYLHVFTYSERPDTAAAEMGDPVPMHIRRQRNAVIRKLSAVKQQQFILQHMGKTRKVLVERSKIRGQLSGFTDNYIKVALPADGYRVNQISEVRLTHEGVSAVIAAEAVSL